MKKCMLIITLILSCFSFSGQAFAAPTTEFLSAWAEHRSYDQSVFVGRADQYYTFAYWELSDIVADVTDASVTVWRKEINLIESNWTPGWGPPPDTRAFYTTLGYTENAMDYFPAAWETTYDFNIETTVGDWTETLIIQEFDMLIMDAPVTTVMGNIVTWGDVAQADRYRLRLINPVDGDLLYQFKDVASGFDLTGQVPNGDYIIRMEARKDGSTGLTARGAYFSSITVTPIPGAIWLLASGLLGLVGYKRRQDR